MRNIFADEFRPIETTEPDFGYIESKVWLRMRLRNTTQSTDDWRLYVRENFLQNYDIYVEREDGTTQHVESHNPNSPFSDRRIAYPELVTPITFAPGEQITLYVSYWSGGSSNAALSFETADSFSALALRRTSKYYISYGMMAILIIASVLALMIFRLEVFWAYLAYVAVTLLYLMHIDGVAFQYMWPIFPRFNSYFSIVVGTFFILATYNFSRVFLRTKEFHPRIDKAFIYLTAASLIIIVPGAFIDPQLTKKLIFVMIFLAIFLGMCTGILASFTRFKEVRFFLFAWICGVGTSGLMNMRHMFGFDIGQDAEFDSIRISIVVDAIMMGLGVADRYRQTLKSRQEATQKSLTEATTNLELNTRLYDLEQQYTLAVELVASRDAEIRNTVHDIRQPLHALRLNVLKLRDGNSLESSEGNSNSANIDDTFSYLESLIASHLQDSVIVPDSGASSTKIMPHDDTELNVSNVLKTIHEMFLPDAQQKGLEFDYVDTTQQANIDPLILMRIITNLVSNAIKYTPSGKVLLGTRRTKASLRVEVHDTGPGMNRAQFRKAKLRNVRLQNSQSDAKGNGYGLSIASDLANKHGFGFYRLETRKNGTSIILEIPLSSDP